MWDWSDSLDRIKLEISFPFIQLYGGKNFVGYKLSICFDSSLSWFTQLHILGDKWKKKLDEWHVAAHRSAIGREKKNN